MTIEQLALFAWPIVAILAAVLFYRQLSDLIGRITGLSYQDEKGRTIRLTASEVRGAALELVVEADAYIRDLGPDEKEILAKVVNSVRTPKVKDIIPGFLRGTKEHDSLRKLRDAQLIRPAGGGHFEADKHLEIKKFGQTLLKIRREQLLQ
jgi:hypothetical protein